MRRALLLVFFGLSLTSIRAEERVLRIVGSDLLGAAFSEGFRQEATERGWNLKLALEGTLLGQTDLQADYAELGLFVVRDGETLPGGEEWMAIPMAYFSLVVAVPVKATLTQIDMPTLAALFGESEAGGSKRWYDLGDQGELRGRTMEIAVVDRGVGLANQILRFTVLSRPNLKPLVNVVPDMQAALALLTVPNPGTLVLLPRLPAGMTEARALAVADATDGVAFTPSAENLSNGDYPIRLPLYVVFRRDRTHQLLPVLNYLLGDAVAANLSTGLLVPVPATQRRQKLFELEEE